MDLCRDALGISNADYQEDYNLNVPTARIMDSKREPKTLSTHITCKRRESGSHPPTIGWGLCRPHSNSISAHSPS